jgi:hypothetical protein
LNNEIVDVGIEGFDTRGFTAEPWNACLH